MHQVDSYSTKNTITPQRLSKCHKLHHRPISPSQHGWQPMYVRGNLDISSSHIGFTFHKQLAQHAQEMHLRHCAVMAAGSQSMYNTSG
jgi:hypothetical protein